MENSNIDREQELKEQFNEFFSRHNIHDLYEQLSVKELIELKKIFSCINNLITLRATIAFVDQLLKDGFIAQDTYEKIIYSVNGQHANTNGFDVEYDGEPGEKIIAEVKCNIPVDKTSFGPAQRDGIVKDILQLQGGKLKAKMNDTSDFYKFMVILDCDEKVRGSMGKIIAKQQKVKEYTTSNDLDKEHVFVMYVTI